MLLEILAVAALLALGGSSSKNTPPIPKRKPHEEEPESFIDRHGREHNIYEDGYCEECDDEHYDY